MIQQDAILAAVVSLLKTPTAVASLIGEVDDIDGIPAAVQSAVVVSLEVSTPEEVTNWAGPLRWETIVRVTCAVRVNRRSAGSRPALQLVGAVFARLASIEGFGLSNVVADLVQMKPADPQRFDTPMAGVDLFYRVQHRSAANDIN